MGNVPFGWFVGLTTAWSVLFAWVTNNARQSLLIPILFHSAINTWLGALGILGVTGGDLRPLILNVALTWVTVVVLVVIYGPQRLSRKEGDVYE